MFFILKENFFSCVFEFIVGFCEFIDIVYFCFCFVFGGFFEVFGDVELWWLFCLCVLFFLWFLCCVWRVCVYFILFSGVVVVMLGLVLSCWEFCVWFISGCCCCCWCELCVSGEELFFLLCNNLLKLLLLMVLWF